MPRLEKEMMDGWEFALNSHEEKDFREITLPHDWAITAPIDREMIQGEAQGFRNRWGTGWYRKYVTLSEIKKEYCYFLDFGGIYENSTIWINGRNAGGHKYGYSSFRVEITDFVKKGENEILIRVDNTAVPADRWYSGAGIYRTVKWIEVEKRHLREQEIVVRSEIGDAFAQVIIETGTEDYVKAILDDGERVQEAGAAGGKVVLKVENPRLWSAEKPNLYSLTLQLTDGERIADQIQMNIGLRKIKMRSGRGMYVNGERVILKGVCLHQDVGCRGIAAKPEIWRKRLENLKELGCNAIRTAHHTFASEFLDLCDEMGFYVYEECFDKWRGGLYGRYFETEWKKDVECMVKRDRNRACIFIWGVGNEVENQGLPSMLADLKMLKEYVYALDDSRPITYAMNPHFKRGSNIDLSTVEDIQKFVDEEDDREIYDIDERMDYIAKIAEVVDVISCNYQEQWYEDIHKRIPDKLILGTETYQFFKGHRCQIANFTCENPQLEPFKKQYVIGGMIWSGIDYLGESMGYPSKGWSGALIRTNGERRPGYYIMQSYWSEKPMVHFSVMDYSLEDEAVKEHWDIPALADHWHFPQFHRAVIPYMIASNCETVSLFLNDKQFYVKRPEEYPNRVITGFLPWQAGNVRVIGYRNGEKVCSDTLVTPGNAVKLKFDQETVTYKAQKGYELMLTVSAADEDGNFYFKESAKVSFQAEGPAEIIAVDNGSLMGSESYDGDAIHMYHGKASVQIRLTGEKGRAVVHAYAEGMQSGKTVICIE